MAARPLGVTIICILGWLGAVLGLIGGLSLVGLGGLGALALTGTGLELLAGLFSVLGLIVLLLSVVQFVVIYWLWKMLKKGWLWTMVLEVIGIVIGVIQVVYSPMTVLGLVIPAIIVIYLWMKKDLFK